MANVIASRYLWCSSVRARSEGEAHRPPGAAAPRGPSVWSRRRPAPLPPPGAAAFRSRAAPAPNRPSAASAAPGARPPFDPVPPVWCVCVFGKTSKGFKSVTRIGKSIVESAKFANKELKIVRKSTNRKRKNEPYRINFSSILQMILILRFFRLPHQEPHKGFSSRFFAFTEEFWK